MTQFVGDQAMQKKCEAEPHDKISSPLTHQMVTVLSVNSSDTGKLLHMI